MMFLWHYLAMRFYNSIFFLIGHLPSTVNIITNPVLKLSILWDLNYVSPGFYLQISMAWVLSNPNIISPVTL